MRRLEKLVEHRRADSGQPPAGVREHDDAAALLEKPVLRERGERGAMPGPPVGIGAKGGGRGGEVHGAVAHDALDDVRPHPILARPLRPSRSEMTESSLMLASSNVFCSRWVWLAFSRTSCLRVRMSVRIASVAASGTKLARISPWARSSASQAASVMSVLRPGTFLTCAAFARISLNPPSSKTCQTG